MKNVFLTSLSPGRTILLSFFAHECLLQPLGLAASQAAISSTREVAQMVADSFRNSSSKNCFPSILLQFHFIYYLAVSRWSHFFSQSCLKETHGNCAAGLGADLWALCPRSQAGAPAHTCSWQNLTLSGLTPCGLPRGEVP